MKSLIISVIIFSVMVTGTVLNAIWSYKELQKIIIMTDEIVDIEDSNTSGKIEKLSEHWKKTEHFLSLTTHRKNLGEVEHELTELSIAYYKKDEYEFAAAKSSIIDIIEEITNSQGFDIKTIF